VGRGGLISSSLTSTLSLLSNLSTRERVLPRTTATAIIEYKKIKFSSALYISKLHV